jgi:hypothetical protein
MSQSSDLQRPERREFLTTASAGGALAIGAAGVAGMTLGGPLASASAALHSLHGRGPGLKGPYLDLSTGRGNQLAYARIQGDLDFGKQKYFWFKGYVMAIEPQKKVVDLMGASGFGVIRLEQGPNGGIRRMCREVIVYTDLRSGDVLDEWKNPLTNETVKAVHVANDPFNYMIEDHFPAMSDFGGLNKEQPPKIPFILPWYQHGGMAEMEIHVHLAYPSALQPDKWPRESAGPIAQVSEFFAHHVKVEDYVTRLHRHVESHHAMAAVDVDGATPGSVSVRLFHGYDTESRRSAHSQRARLLREELQEIFRCTDGVEHGSQSLEPRALREGSEARTGEVSFALEYS